MGPDADDFNDSFLIVDLIDEPMLNVDSARIRAGQVAHKFFVWRGILVRIIGQDRKECLCFRLQSGAIELFGVFSRLSGVNEFPAHQSSSAEQSDRSAASPSLIDSRMPGMESK